MKKLTKKEAQIKLNELEDKMCNTDYTTSKGLLIYNNYKKEANKMMQILDGEI